MVSANHWLSGIKIYRLSWYLTGVSANHASSNSALDLSLPSDMRKRELKPEGDEGGGGGGGQGGWVVVMRGLFSDSESSDQ